MNKLIISNSQGTWLDTDGIPYTSLLADKNTFIYARSGMDLTDIMNNFDNIFKTNSIDIVIIQLGIVEISNRILHERTKKNLLKVPLIGSMITKIIWLNKFKWMKFKKLIGLKDSQKMSIQKFKFVYSNLCEKVFLTNVKKIYIIGIPMMNCKYLETENPYINDFIKEANFVLKSLQSENIEYIDIQELLSNDEKFFTRNTVHFTKLGHERLANYLRDKIKELNFNV